GGARGGPSDHPTGVGAGPGADSPGGGLVILTAPEQLSRARELVEPATRSSVGRLAPEVRRVAAYHLGFADQNGHPAETAAGKALRPALAFLSAEAAGAPAETAVPGAVAVELVHNFSLLHDD